METTTNHGARIALETTPSPAVAAATACSPSSIRCTAMQDNPGGAKELARLVTKWGGLPERARQCPDCGGPLEIEDARGFLKPEWRYSLGCEELDCRAVSGPTVQSVLKLWIEECPVTKRSVIRTRASFQ